MYVFLSIRFLLVHLESIVLPVFIAMIATDSLRGTGNNFVLGIVGIIFWPLGWALGHIGTLALANWFDSMVALTLHVPGTLQPGAIYDMIVNGPAGGLPAPDATGVGGSSRYHICWGDNNWHLRFGRNICPHRLSSQRL